MVRLAHLGSSCCSFAGSIFLRRATCLALVFHQPGINISKGRFRQKPKYGSGEHFRFIKDSAEESFQIQA